MTVTINREEKHPMSLRSKILLILLVVVALYAALDYGIQRLVVFPSFIALEQHEAKKDLERCFEALRRESYHLDTFNHDWAAWDDTYEFVRNRSTEYISSNLVAQTFIDNNLNLIYVCDEGGRVVWGQIRNVDTWHRLLLKEFPAESLPPTNPLLSHDNVHSAIAGVLSTEYKPMLVSSRPIVTTNNEGPIRGTLIMGRFLTGDSVQTLVEQTRVNFRLWPIMGHAMPEKERDILNRISNGQPLLTSDNDNNLLLVYDTFPDIQGVPALLVRADIPREISAKGAAALRFALLSILVGGAVILVVLFISLQRTVVGPMAKLTAHVVEIGKRDDLSARLSLPRRDEIGILAQECDRMVEQLSEARKKLLEQSYHSGMAEMASGILHNTRNSLNPLVVDIDILRQELRKAPIEKIEMARTELTEGAPSSQRRKDLNTFLDLANKNLVTLMRKVRAKLDDVASRVSHIEEILPNRDTLSSRQRPMEEFRLDELVRDSIALIPGDLSEIVSVGIDPSLGKIGSVRAHRVSLWQILANLLVNAAESIKRANLMSGTIEIQADSEQVNGIDTIHLRISDDGQGIDPKNLERVFERGFTMNKKESWGLGLHWSANTIAAMNGRLYAESAGIGRGACFHLLFPRDK
jgi:two-component system NtrC family sensor kinase